MTKIIGFKEFTTSPFLVQFYFASIAALSLKVFSKGYDQFKYIYESLNELQLLLKQNELFKMLLRVSFFPLLKNGF